MSDTLNPITMLATSGGKLIPVLANSSGQLMIDCPSRRLSPESIYSDTVVGSRITEALEEYSYFQFQITGVDADDDVSIAISMDGVNFDKIPVVNVATGAVVAAGTNIEVPGTYRYGSTNVTGSAGDNPVGLMVSQVKVTRETATGANQVDVVMGAG